MSSIWLAIVVIGVGIESGLDTHHLAQVQELGVHLRWALLHGGMLRKDALYGNRLGLVSTGLSRCTGHIWAWCNWAWCNCGMADAHLHRLLRSQRDVQAVDQGRLFARREQTPRLQLRLQASLIGSPHRSRHQPPHGITNGEAAGSAARCLIAGCHRYMVDLFVLQAIAPALASVEMPQAELC
jgi:hypothetical protein